MSPDQVMEMFANHYVDGKTEPADKVTMAFAGWLSEYWDALSPESVALLTILGGTLFEVGVEANYVRPGTSAESTTQALMEALTRKSA
ncbi:hypothetical protein JOE11_004995 [Robbsia andropogonis]|uniref:hypothetical protein n=1 Tax=Robbsia andropogonis TaxID=28092 RepID=UPI003D1E54F1